MSRILSSWEKWNIPPEKDRRLALLVVGVCVVQRGRGESRGLRGMNVTTYTDVAVVLFHPVRHGQCKPGHLDLSLPCEIVDPRQVNRASCVQLQGGGANGPAAFLNDTLQ